MSDDASAGGPVPPPPPPDPDSPERRDLEASPSTRCLNCGASLPGSYCPTCGQKDQPLRTPVHRFVVNTLAEYLGLDGRLWPTLRLLIVRPGRLTQAYIRGQRERYIRPLRIYLTASVLFFLVLSLADPLGSIRQLADQGTISPDSTVLASQYLAQLDSLVAVEVAEDSTQRALLGSLQRDADSLRTRLRRDRLAGISTDTLDAHLDALAALEDEIEEEEGDLQRMTGSTTDRRLSWKRDLVASYRPDSSIRPFDIETAAELVIHGDDGPQGTLNGPDWLLGGESARRLRSARTATERNDAAWSLGRDVIAHLPKVIFLLLPVFALLLKLLYVRNGWYYAEHLVFALHTHAFAFVIFTLVALLAWGTGGAAWVGAVATAFQLLIPVYFVIAMKRVYAQGWLKTLVKVYLLSWMYGTVLIGGVVLAVALAAAIG